MQAVRHLLCYGDKKLFCDSIVFSSKVGVREVGLCRGGIYTGILGTKDRLITLEGKILYTDKSGFVELVESLSGIVATVTVDSVPYNNVCMVESSLEFGSDSQLGRFRLVLRRGMNG